ncbi:MAG: hypothetical protein H0U72_13665 [Nitrosospira sp.]|nr:hypothetical protein [Nitrosospira sp.]
MYIKNLTIVVTLLSLTGCASVYQTRFGLTHEDQKHATARPYYLPKALVSFSSSVDKKTKIPTFTMSPKLVADTTKTLYLVRNHNGFYDDNFVVETTIDGLLTSVKTKTTFKGLEIAEKIGELAGLAVQLAAAQEPGTCTPEKMPFTLDLEIDPANLKEANDKLKLFCFKVEKVDTDKKGEITNYLLEIDKDSALKQDVTVRDGIAYRSTTDIILSAEYTGLGEYIKRVFRVNIPDISAIFYAPTSRSIFVTRQHDYTFTKGVLTSSTVDHPSEVLGLISIPVEILNGIAKAITGRFGKKTESLNNEVGYINAQKSLLQAQKELEEARKK